MEFHGVIEYNLMFLVNFILGVCFAVPHYCLVNRLVLNPLVKSILVFYLVLFVCPVFIVNEWASQFDLVLTILYVETFLAFSMLGYLILSPFVCYKTDRGVKGIVDYNQCIRKNKISGIFLAFFVIVSILFLVLFVLKPSYSGMYIYFYGVGNPRFAWYSAPDYLQLFYGLYNRILVTAAVILTMRSKYKYFVVVLSLSVLLNSVERQVVVILLFVYLYTISVNHKIKLMDTVMLMLIMASLIFVFIMQGNTHGLESLSIEDVLFNSLSIIYNRIFIDPLYMFSHISEYYGALYLLGETNRLIAVISGSYTSGFSAIGLLADGYVNFGLVGAIVSGVWFSVMLVVAKTVQGIRQGFLLGKLTSLLMFIACVSLYYSNMFSLMPLSIVFLTIVLLLLNKLRNAGFRPLSLRKRLGDRRGQDGVVYQWSEMNGANNF